MHLFRYIYVHVYVCAVLVSCSNKRYSYVCCQIIVIHHMKINRLTVFRKDANTTAVYLIPSGLSSLQTNMFLFNFYSRFKILSKNIRVSRHECKTRLIPKMKAKWVQLPSSISDPICSSSLIQLVCL